MRERHEVEARLEYQESLLKMVDGEIPESDAFKAIVNELGDRETFKCYIQGCLSSLYWTLQMARNPHTGREF